MDPFTIAVVLVLAGMIGAAADVATGGLVRAELFGGAKGAAKWAGSAGRQRWREAKKAARRERMKTPLGRATQYVLDEVGGLGRGLVRGWRSGRRSARTRWQEARGDQPLPIVQVCREVGERARTKLRQDPDGDPNEPRCSWTVSHPFWAAFGFQKGCGKPATHGPLCAEHDAESRTTGCIECEQPMGTNPACGECTTLLIARGEVGPYGPNGEPEQEVDDPGPLPPKCPDCGMPIVLPNGLNDHRLGRERCPYADPNEQPSAKGEDMPNVWRTHPIGEDKCPMESTEDSANGTRWIRECGRPRQSGSDYCEDHAKDPNWAGTHVGASTSPTPPVPRTEGPTAVADINSAPAAINAWEAIGSRWESLQSRADAVQGELDALKNDTDALHGEIATLADGMGDFAIGGEPDLAAAVSEAVTCLASANEQAVAAVTALGGTKERTDAYTDNLHLEYDASIEAAAGQGANVHQVMQEV